MAQLFDLAERLVLVFSTVRGDQGEHLHPIPGWEEKVAKEKLRGQPPEFVLGRDGWRGCSAWAE